ncbi:MAG: S1 RNA-binding domain-containing protein [Chloroflexota bacterium]
MSNVYPAGDDVSSDASWFDPSNSFDVPVRGEIRTGTVVTNEKNEILIDISAKSEGVIDRREVEGMTDSDRKELKVGQQVSVFVVNPEDRDGYTILSISRAEEELDWQRAEELKESKDVFEGIVTDFNKGGVLVKIGRLRGFVPASQLDSNRNDIGHGPTPEERWGNLMGKTVRCKVIEVDRDRNRLILSERYAVKEWRDSQREKLIDELKEGDTRDGRVINLADFGAFVDIGGADGLVHISELSWKRVNHPSEVVQVGEQVEVYILNVDRERQRIGLSIKRCLPDPWAQIEEEYRVGTLVEGTVTKLTKFGAFAQIKGQDHIEGLIHISELSSEHVEHPSSIVQEGDTLPMRVIRLDSEHRRLGLSLKQVASDEFEDHDWGEVSQWPDQVESADF